MYIHYGEFQFLTNNIGNLAFFPDRVLANALYFQVASQFYLGVALLASGIGLTAYALLAPSAEVGYRRFESTRRGNRGLAIVSTAFVILLAYTSLQYLQLAPSQSLNTDLSGKVSSLQQQNSNLNSQIASLQAQNSQLQGQVAFLKAFESVAKLNNSATLNLSSVLIIPGGLQSLSGNIIQCQETSLGTITYPGYLLVSWNANQTTYAQLTETFGSSTSILRSEDSVTSASDILVPITPNHPSFSFCNQGNLSLSDSVTFSITYVY
jgi:predicted small integral membrane protein